MFKPPVRGRHIAALALLASTVAVPARAQALESVEEVAAFVNRLTEPDLLPDGAYREARQEGDSFVFEGLALVAPARDGRTIEARAERLVLTAPVADGDVLVVGEARVENGRGVFAGTGETALEVGLIAVSDARLTPVGGQLIADGLSDLGGFRIEDLTGAPGIVDGSVQRLVYEASGFEGDVPAEARLEVGNLRPRVALPAPFLAPFGERPLAVSGSFILSEGKATVDLDVTIENALRAALDLSLGGVTPENLRPPEGSTSVPIDAVELIDGTLAISRGETFDARLDALAAAFGRDPAGLRAVIADGAGYYAGYTLGNTPDAERLWNAATAFVAGDVERVAIGLAPPETPSLAALLATYQRDTSRMASALGLSIDTQ